MNGPKPTVLAGLAGLAAAAAGLAALTTRGVMKTVLGKKAVGQLKEEEARRQGEAIKRKHEYFAKKREKAARQSRTHNHD